MRRLSHKLTATAAALMVSASGLVAGSVLRATVAPHLALASCNNMACEAVTNPPEHRCVSASDSNCQLDNDGQSCTGQICEDDCTWFQRMLGIC